MGRCGSREGAATAECVWRGRGDSFDGTFGPDGCFCFCRGGINDETSVWERCDGLGDAPTALCTVDGGGGSVASKAEDGRCVCTGVPTAPRLRLRAKSCDDNDGVSALPLGMRFSALLRIVVASVVVNVDVNVVNVDVVAVVVTVGKGQSLAWGERHSLRGLC